MERNYFSLYYSTVVETKYGESVIKIVNNKRQA